MQNCGVDLRLPAALQRRSVCQNYEVQHVGRTYVGESVGGHLDGVGLSLGDELSLAVRHDFYRLKQLEAIGITARRIDTTGAFISTCHRAYFHSITTDPSI